MGRGKNKNNKNNKRKKLSSDSGGSSSSCNGGISVSGILNETNSVLYTDTVGQNMTSYQQQQFTSTPAHPHSSTQAYLPATPGTISFLSPPQGQSPVGLAQATVAPQWALDIVSAVRSLDKKVSDVSLKLEKLEGLENQVLGLSSKITTFEGDIAIIKRDVSQSVQKTKELVEALTDRADNLDFRVSDIDDRIVSLEQKNEELKWQIVDARARSMRDNLIFTGIDEVTDETPDKTEELLRTFLREKLRMVSEMVDAIRFDRVHRMAGQARPRAIVAKFNDFKQRQEVRSRSSVLKGTHCYVNEQFPPEIVEQRKELIKVMREKKNSGHRTRLVYNKLYIDGVLYKPPPTRRPHDGH